MNACDVMLEVSELFHLFALFSVIGGGGGGGGYKIIFLFSQCSLII